MEVAEVKDPSSADKKLTISSVVSVPPSKDEKRSRSFVTSADIFRQEAEEERAKKSKKTKHEEKSVSIEKLYESFGINVNSESESNHRLHVVHMKGVENLSTKDILKYFDEYTPTSIEQINDESCNVVWQDQTLAARAVLGKSQKIIGAEKESKHSSPSDNASKQESANDEAPNEKHNQEENAIHIKDIKCPVPSGVWRKGYDFKDSKNIFLRFATESDKKQPHMTYSKYREKRRERSTDRSRDRRRDRSRDKSRDRSRDKSRDRSRDRRRDRSRDKSKDRSRDKSRDRSGDRNRVRGRDRERDLDWDRRRDRYRDKEETYWNRGLYREDRDRTRGRDRERDNWDRERQRSEERHGEIGNSYYGTQVRKGTEDLEKNGNRESNKSEGVKEKKNGEEKASESLETIPPKQRRTVDLLTSKTGGAYIPPAKLRMMQAEITDKSGAAYQRIAWEALKKSIHGYINKVNTSNIGPITRDLLKENVVRGRGLLTRSIIQAQAASLTFTPVYAALVAVINSKFPNIGELLLKRLAIQFKRGFRRNDKTVCISSATFIAHLINQGVAHEILILEILTLLVQAPTDDSIEVAIAVLKECGMKLTQVSNKSTVAIFEMLRNILHEGQLDKRVQYMIEVIFQIRKDGFKDYEPVSKELDLVEEEDQMTHLLSLTEATDGQDILNVFKYDAEYINNEDKYKELSKEILNSDSESGEEDSDDGEIDSDENSDDEEVKDNGLIVDNTETNLTTLRRTIYLTIHSSLDFEECAHKLLKMQLKPGQEIELCHMFLDCCAEMRTYEKFFGLLAARFCSINRTYVGPFEQIFKSSYDTIHRLDTNRLRNVGKFFAHLLMTDSVSWAVLSNIKLNEEDTTSSSRVFIKILFQELSEYMGLPKLNEKLKDEDLQEALGGLFPKDDPKNTRFAINFFTSIGLGGLTDDLRDHLKNRPKPVPEPAVVKVEPEKPEPPESSSSESSSSESSSSSSSSSDSSDSSEDDKKKKRKVKERRKKKNLKRLSEGRKEAKSDRNKSKKIRKEKSPKEKRHDNKKKKRK